MGPPIWKILIQAYRSSDMNGLPKEALGDHLDLSLQPLGFYVATSFRGLRSRVATGTVITTSPGLQSHSCLLVTGRLVPSSVSLDFTVIVVIISTTAPVTNAGSCLLFY